MINVIISELRKLRRPTLLLSTLATVSALSGLFTSLVFLRINSGSNTKRGESISALQLSHETGLTYGFKLVGVFLGLVALCVFASQTAQEYTFGTLRNLLVRQPSRMKLLLGKLIAMKIFAMFMVIFAGTVSIALSYLLSGRAKVDTTKWSNAHALHLLAQTSLNLFIATICYGLLGMILGLLFRSPISAISIGVLWSLILENILGAVLSGTMKWLPAANFSNIGEGGSAVSSYQHSLFTSALYIFGGGTVVAILFKRRDVAN